MFILKILWVVFGKYIDLPCHVGGMSVYALLKELWLVQVGQLGHEITKVLKKEGFYSVSEFSMYC